MKIPISISQHTDNLQLLLAIVRDLYGDIRDAINGQLELTENMGAMITGVTGAGNATNDVAHILGRPPVYVWLTPEMDITATVPVPVFYWRSTDRTTALWTSTSIRFRCNAATITYRGWVI